MPIKIDKIFNFYCVNRETGRIQNSLFFLEALHFLLCKNTVSNPKRLDGFMKLISHP